MRLPQRMLWIALTLAALAPGLLAAQEVTQEWGKDRKGNDYTDFRARNLADCQRACRDDDRCRAYTFDNRDNTCYLKDRVNSAKDAVGMVTGYKRGDDDDYDGGDYGGGRGGSLTEERGYDRRGNDYTSFRARNLADCKRSCRREDRCRAYTFDTRDDVCYLKTRVNSAQRDGRMVTGYKRDRDPGDDAHGDGWGRLTEERGYDRRGNDYTSFRSRGLGDCQAACRKDDRCRAYTYDTRNDACYLKDRVNSQQRDGGMVTGYKRDRD